MTIHATIIQKLLSTNAQIGRRITSHHLKPYLHGTRNSLAIIDSDKTLISLRTALDFISNLAQTPTRSSKPVKFLFVNTNPVYDDIFDHMTRLTGFGSFFSPQGQYWRRNGFLTNPHSPKKFRGRGKKLCFAPVDPPDCIVVVDTDMKSSVVNEAYRVGVPVVALVDSNTPLEVYEKIAYPIVVGGESVQFVYMMCNLITKTMLLAKKMNPSYVTLEEEVAPVRSPDEIISDFNVSGDGDGSPGTDNVNANLDLDAAGEQEKPKEADETTQEIKIVPHSA